MVKVHTNISIDADLISKAKEGLVNISDAAEEAIKKRLNIKSVDIVESDKCEFCGREQEKATKEDLEGLTWLWPDEKWICTFCLKDQIRVDKRMTDEKRAEILQLAKNYVLENKNEILSQMKGKEII
jgi:hypothetical protein